VGEDRRARGGRRCGWTPDLFTFGKVIGGGYPLAALAGRADVMEQLSPSGPVYQAGTLSGNPVAATAGLVTLQHCDDALYRTLDERAAQVVDVVRRRCRGMASAPGAAGRQPVQHLLPRGAGADFADAADQDEAAFARFFHGMLDAGVYLPPSAFEAWFVSGAHGDEELEHLAGALMPNRLAASTSPYLRQHADNPVDWREWGEEAFAEARERDVPIFLSVGYSACHWCHVMAHESFEDETTAAELNARFVNVKVDREERPDVDAIYMKAVQGMTGRGGWPMSVFLTPDGEPFYAGTYFPKDDRHGMPSFLKVVRSVSERVGGASRRGRRERGGDHGVDRRIRRPRTGRHDRCARGHPRCGGARAPASVGPHARRFRSGTEVPAGDDDHVAHRALRPHRGTTALAAAVQALDHMARGGINDLLAGGFARYSTDERWLVPHFEKMLYDNALLLPAYALAAAVRAQRRPLAASRATVETAEFMRCSRRSRPRTASFVAAFDADTDGVEGLHLRLDPRELREVVAATGTTPTASPASSG
jgi:hypothetical protein